MFLFENDVLGIYRSCKGERRRLQKIQKSIKKKFKDFLGDTADKNPPAYSGDMSSIPGPGRFHMPQGN